MMSLINQCFSKKIFETLFAFFGKILLNVYLNYDETKTKKEDQ